MAPHVADYVVQLVAGTQGRLQAARRYLRGGASPRAAQALVLGSKLRALLQGRENAALDDVRGVRGCGGDPPGQQVRPALLPRILGWEVEVPHSLPGYGWRKLYDPFRKRKTRLLLEPWASHYSVCY